ncbi:MAG: helix-hairpin-helix domain-containing protein [Rhodothermales bacterium]|nr:helix-hairpin-helix domain-containing protein [Rhodothermales bacterium]
MWRSEIRKYIYRLEVRFGLTSAEFRGYLLLALLMAAGVTIREFSLRIPAVDQDLYRELEEEFARQAQRMRAMELVGPVQEELPDLAVAPMPAVRPENLIDLNTATSTQLETLPRIGPALAGRILRHRQRYGPFRSVNDLLMVDGIGPATLSGLRLLVRAGLPANGPADGPPREAPRQ